jgi:hypothetical protein
MFQGLDGTIAGAFGKIFSILYHCLRILMLSMDTFCTHLVKELQQCCCVIISSLKINPGNFVVHSMLKEKRIWEK